ncbi:hypothetical protein IT157_04510 [bacterium]|nr:hypothetical protein [bacterium]
MQITNASEIAGTYRIRDMVEDQISHGSMSPPSCILKSDSSDEKEEPRESASQVVYFSPDSAIRVLTMRKLLISLRMMTDGNVKAEELINELDKQAIGIMQDVLTVQTKHERELRSTTLPVHEVVQSGGTGDREQSIETVESLLRKAMLPSPMRVWTRDELREKLLQQLANNKNTRIANPENALSTYLYRARKPGTRAAIIAIGPARDRFILAR